MTRFKNSSSGIVNSDYNVFVTHDTDGQMVTNTSTDFVGAVFPLPPETANHFSEGKPGVDQIPPQVLLELGRVYEYGQKKYGRDNWLKGTAWSEFYGSALRHVLKWWGGEDIDPESGLPHLSHAMWNIVALEHFQMQHLGVDNRPNRVAESADEAARLDQVLHNWQDEEQRKAEAAQHEIEAILQRVQAGKNQSPRGTRFK